MHRLSFLILAGLATTAGAAPQFGYDFSDTRTFLTGDALHFTFDYPSVRWSGTLKTDAGDADLFLNGIEATAGAGFDPNIGLYPPQAPMDYFAAGMPGSYALGTAIPGGVDWSLREIVGFDEGYNIDVPAAGLYDFTLTFRGGADADAWDVLATFDLHLEVADRLDVGLSATGTPIDGVGGVGHVSLSATNLMGRDLAITGAFVPLDGLQIDPSDPFSPSLSGVEAGDWKGRIIGAGATLTGAHSDWTLNPSTVDGTYTGGLGLIGGLHYGDSYFLFAESGPAVTVNAFQPVPEPSTWVALSLGAVTFLRHRARTRA